MVRGPRGDAFRADWLILPLRALLADRGAPRRSSTVGIAVDDQLLQVRATPSGIEVNPHDGRALDAVVRADGAIVLGLAAGVLTLADTVGIIDIEGDETAVRAIFTPHATRSEAAARASGRLTSSL